MHCDKPRDFLGLTANGGYAEYMVAGASAFCRVPQGWSAVEAAPVVCTFGTVWRGGVVRGRARAGETVLVTGASGGVGSAAVQLFAAMGCRVIAGTTSPSKAAALQQLGAHHVLIAPDGQFHRLPELKQCPPVDLALDAVGTPTFLSAMRSLRRGGRLVFVGNVTNGEVGLRLGYPIIQGLELIASDSCSAADVEAAFAFMDLKGIRPLISSVLPLSEVQQAHETLKGKRAPLGRIVLRVREDW